MAVFASNYEPFVTRVGPVEGLDDFNLRLDGNRAADFNGLKTCSVEPFN